METTEIRTLVIALTSLFLLLGLFVLIFFWAYKKNQNVKEKQIADLNKEILKTQLEIQEQTLKTISEEIHDNIGQGLSLAKLKLNTIDVTKEYDLKEKIADSKNLVSKAIQDLRDLSRSLNTDNIADMGLLRAIEYELDMIRKSGYETILEVNGDSKRMEPQRELIVFRIVQETLNNVIKHAEAKKITVTASYSADKLDLRVQDDGKGTEMPLSGANETNNKSLGIRNMHNRAKMIGAGFAISSVPGKGTVIHLNIPLNNT